MENSDFFLLEEKMNNQKIIQKYKIFFIRGKQFG